MDYLSIYKASFIGKGESEYKKRYNSDCTLHFDIGPEKDSSFFYLNMDLILIMEEIMLINDKIIYQRHNGGNFIHSWEYNYSLVEEIMLSNEIEGVSSTRKELTELLDIKKPEKYKRLYGMVNKYRSILDKNKEFVPIRNAKEFRNVYDEIILEDIRRESPEDIPDGRIFRKEEVNVVSSTKIIHKGLYPEDRIIQCMDKALMVLNDEKIPCLIRVALSHYFVGYIHPFYDGNGRMSRYISSYYLTQVLDPVSALRLSSACKKRQKDYYQAFKITNDPRNKGDITYFVMMFLDILKDGLKEYLSVLSYKTDQYRYYKDLIKNLNIDERSKKILQLIFEVSMFSYKKADISIIMKGTGLSKATVSNRIKGLEEKSYIIRKRQGKTTFFEFNEDLTEESV